MAKHWQQLTHLRLQDHRHCSRSDLDIFCEMEHEGLTFEHGSHEKVAFLSVFVTVEGMPANCGSGEALAPLGWRLRRARRGRERGRTEGFITNQSQSVTKAIES